VRYCCDGCQELHREQHEEEDCKKRYELHDKELFEQPEKTCYGECPLCFLPLPIDQRKSSFYSCCCKSICKGCEIAYYKSSGHSNCAFCREPALDTEEENYKRVMERVKANDPAALNQMGRSRYNEGDYKTAFEYWTKAAELGDADAYYGLGDLYDNGEGVEKEEEKLFIMLRRLPLEVIPTLDTILRLLREKMVTLREP